MRLSITSAAPSVTWKLAERGDHLLGLRFDEVLQIHVERRANATARRSGSERKKSACAAPAIPVSCLRACSVSR